ARWERPTPAGAQPPRWALPLVAIPRRRGETAPPKRSRLYTWAPAILGSAQVWLIGAAIAYGLRYAAVVWYADRVAPWWIEAVTPAPVCVSGPDAVAVGVAAAVVAADWLV